LSRHIDKIVMRTVEEEGKRYYVASGEWSCWAIGIGGVVAHSPLPHHQDVRVRIRRFRGLRSAIEQSRQSPDFLLTTQQSLRRDAPLRLFVAAEAEPQ